MFPVRKRVVTTAVFVLAFCLTAPEKSLAEPLSPKALWKACVEKLARTRSRIRARNFSENWSGELRKRIKQGGHDKFEFTFFAPAPNASAFLKIHRIVFEALGLAANSTRLLPISELRVDVLKSRYLLKRRSGLTDSDDKPILGVAEFQMKGSADSVEEFLQRVSKITKSAQLTSEWKIHSKEGRRQESDGSSAGLVAGLDSLTDEEISMILKEIGMKDLQSFLTEKNAPQVLTTKLLKEREAPGVLRYLEWMLKLLDLKITHRWVRSKLERGEKRITLWVEGDRTAYLLALMIPRIEGHQLYSNL